MLDDDTPEINEYMMYDEEPSGELYTDVDEEEEVCHDAYDLRVEKKPEKKPEKKVEFYK